jgi:hypothetical protein
MQISQEIGTGNLHPPIPVPPSHKAGGSSSTQDAPSHGPPNFSLKLHCLLPRPSTLLSHKHCVTSFPVMSLLQEMREQNFKVVCIEPYVYCKVFEDNAGALELARLPKLRPRTKHMNVWYIIFAKTCERGLSRSSPLTPKTTLLMHSQKLWHKMTSSVIVAIYAVRNLSKLPKGSVM